MFSSTYRVLRYDFRGYGRSSRPEAGKPYSHVSDLAAVMDAAGVERAALIGDSMGGGVAVDFALGSLYALALTDRRSLGAVTPIGGVCLLLGWALLAFAIVVK